MFAISVISILYVYLTIRSNDQSSKFIGCYIHLHAVQFLNEQPEIYKGFDDIPASTIWGVFYLHECSLSGGSSSIIYQRITAVELRREHC